MTILFLCSSIALAERPADGTADFPVSLRSGERDEQQSKALTASVPRHHPMAGCTQPDAATLRAILPVATDHGSHATGVVYDTNRVLTAAHAVQGGKQFFVKVGDAFQAADLVMMDPGNDLAVLAVDTQHIRPLHIAGFNPARSQPVWAVGYPRAQAMMTSTGVVQDNQAGTVQASASIDSGQSGGGLLSCQNGVWEMLGMLRGYGAYRQGDRYVKLPNYSVSVAAATINQFLRHSP
jgi:hypothetical protein